MLKMLLVSNSLLMKLRWCRWWSCCCSRWWWWWWWCDRHDKSSSYKEKREGNERGRRKTKTKTKTSQELRKEHHRQNLTGKSDVMWATAVDNGATSNKGRGGNLVAKTTPPTQSPCSTLCQVRGPTLKSQKNSRGSQLGNTLLSQRTQGSRTSRSVTLNSRTQRLS
jgi:hypothetical protein